jgi:hypothetical protein
MKLTILFVVVVGAILVWWLRSVASTHIQAILANLDAKQVSDLAFE